MFDDETLIRHMMEPAPGERGRPPLNQVSVEKLKQALYARFGKTPIVCDHESVKVRSPPNRIHCQNYECDDRKLSLLCFNFNELVFSMF